MKTIARTLACVSVLWPAVATAELEQEVLFQKGNWQTIVAFDAEDGRGWCASYTENNKGQQFDITIFKDRSVVMYIFDDRWDLRERSVNFRLDIDRERWDMQGTAKGTAISLDMTGSSEEAVDFLDDVYKGNTVTLFNEDGRNLAKFSLKGSAASLLKLLECADLISKGDPTTSSDPFGSSADPFN